MHFFNSENVRIEQTKSMYYTLQIPMGVLLHNENKLDEMSKILEHFMKYVPTLTKEGEITLPNASKVPFDDTHFFTLLLGGDQLTATRIRGTQALRVTQDNACDRLQGLIPVVEDWHARMALVDVSVHIVILIPF